MTLESVHITPSMADTCLSIKTLLFPNDQISLEILLDCALKTYLRDLQWLAEQARTDLSQKQIW